VHILDRPRPVLFWLRFLVVICVVPPIATTALAIRTSYEREHAVLAESIVRTARDLMQAVDLDLASATAALQVLAISPDLDSGNLSAFRDHASEVLLSQTGNGIVLTEATGQQLMNTLKPYDEPLPRTGVKGGIKYGKTVNFQFLYRSHFQTASSCGQRSGDPGWQSYPQPYNGYSARSSSGNPA
jgi:hypothetical protein